MEDMLEFLRGLKFFLALGWVFRQEQYHQILQHLKVIYKLLLEFNLAKSLFLLFFLVATGYPRFFIGGPDRLIQLLLYLLIAIYFLACLIRDGLFISGIRFFVEGNVQIINIIIIRGTSKCACAIICIHFWLFNYFEIHL